MGEAFGNIFTGALAQFVVRTVYTDLPQSAVQRATWIVADTFGVELRGSIEHEAERLYLRMLAETKNSSDGNAVVFRQGLPRLDAHSAAFLNATSACFLELDEGSRPTGHPALHVLPSALALAQQLHVSGREFLTAFILGYEVQARIQRASQLRAVVHPHGNFGNVGAVASLGKLLGWSSTQMYQGLLNATALVMSTSWQPCLVGATIRNTYPAMTAQTAFTICRLVECGFNGYDNALEETFGQILGVQYLPEELSRDLGTSYAIEENYFKFHAACALTHPVLDALNDALGGVYQPGCYPPYRVPVLPSPDEISRVRVAVLERSMRLNVRSTGNQLSAKFSIPHAVATFLVRGVADIDSFSGTALTDPVIESLAGRTEVISDPGLSFAWPEQHPSYVEISLADGRTLVGRCTNPFGSITAYPTEADLKGKFDYLTNNILVDEIRDMIWSMCISLPDIEDVFDITDTGFKG